MGRRKIDIEPITNERNRSVTFLKRKNGLFKKAYELGTLCTVDIAVIVFEERPGHPVKMHQYCSNNINHVMQRFIRFEGKRECRGPLDYNDKLGDDDDEDEIEDEAPPPPPVPVKRPSGKATTRTMSMSTDIKPNIRAMASSSASDPDPLTKRQRLATDFDPVAAFADMPASSSHRYQQGLMAAASSASNLGLAALFPPRSSHGIGLPGLTYPIQHSAFVGLPPATNHPSLYGLPPAHGHAPLGGLGQGHDYHGPPPDIRASAAASYAAALARGDVHTARVASAALYGMHDGGSHGHDGLAGSPPSASMLPSSRYADTFEFEWPEHRVSASRSGQGQSLFDPVGRSSSSQQDRSAANRLDPRSADDLWLSFLGSGDNARDNNGGNNAGPSPAVRTVAENGESVESWLHSLDSGTGMAGMDGDGDLPRSNSDSAEHSLPSPVHSHGGDE